jgi:hypothetical protein
VMILGECGWQKSMSVVTLQAVAAAQPARGKLSLMRVAVANSAVVGMSSRKSPPKGRQRGLWLPESRMAGRAGYLVVRWREREARTVVQRLGQRRIGSLERIVNNRVTVSA